jgi:hypothetical protein
LHSAYTDTVCLLIFSSFLFYWLRSFLCHFYFFCSANWGGCTEILCCRRWFYYTRLSCWFGLFRGQELVSGFDGRHVGCTSFLHVVIFWCTTSPLKEPV